MTPNADSERFIQIGWWLPEALRPKGMSNYEWETERICTVKLVEAEGGMRPDFVEYAVPLYAKTEP